MRFWFILLLALMACGPSSTQIKQAKTAHYNVEADVLLGLAIEAAQRDYKIGQVDQQNLRFATEPQMYSPEGGRQSPGAGGFVSMSDRSVMLTLVVEVLKGELDNKHVVVTPVTLQVVSGSPKPRELKPDDPNLPGWVHGRVDSLAVAIYEAAKLFEVK